MFKYVYWILITVTLSFQVQAQSDTASPEALVRRLFLDLYNRLPSENEYLESKEKIKNASTTKSSVRCCRLKSLTKYSLQK